MTEVDPAEQRALVLLEKYETEIRRELVALESNLLPDLDAAAALLRAALASKREVHVGFLGESQVGKSSLINALLGRIALPTGGVGPLTAQATRLRYASTPVLDVRYHDRRRLNQFAFALRQYLAARGELVGKLDDVADESLEDVTAAAWSSAASVESDGVNAPPKSGMGEHLLDQARLMLGAGGLSNGAVHDAVRAILDLDPVGDATAYASCAQRIHEIRDLLGGVTTLSSNGAGPAAFGEALHVNAAGWRSPLVAELDLALDVELLSRVEVVDLPGVGVVGDPAGRVAEAFVRDDATALVIVARNNGLTQEVVSLLERTGVITRLLFGGESSRTNPIHIIFAITRLDDVAQDRWKQERAQAKQHGVPPPSREEVFRRLSGEMETKAKEQIRRVLASSSQFEDLTPEMRARREQVVGDLCDRAEVVCVSAKDFMNIESDDDEDRSLAFIQNPDATNIPYFREQIAKLAESARGSRRGRIHRALESFRNLLASHVDALEVNARGRSVGTSDADRFREALGAMVPPFKERATVQRREVSTYLTERIPPKLEEVTLQAATLTRKRLARLRKKGDGLHWASLNAALVRNGTWNKQGIDYPGELTMGFVEVIAGAWEPSIIEEVRRVIRNLVDHHVDLVEEFLAQASELSGGDELIGQITAQKRLLKEQGKSAVGWTSEQLNELNDDVRKKLGALVAKHLERACLHAVKAGHNRGAGARTRILDVFETSGNAAIDRARDQCDEVLKDRFRTLRSSLGRLLRENEDPISQCYEAIVQQGASLAAQAGREERERIAAALARVRAAMDPPPGKESPPSVRGSAPPRRVSVPALTAVTTPARDAATEIFASLVGAE
jgi:hypothetical protein